MKNIYIVQFYSPRNPAHLNFTRVWDHLSGPNASLTNFRLTLIRE